MKKIIVINGYLASGKSTFAGKLSEKFQLPCFVKDTFKIAICKQIELNSRSQKSIFSSVTFDAMMYVTEQIMKCGYPLIIEGNFMPTGMKKTDEAGTIQSLIQKYEYSALNLKFSGDTKVLHQRFLEREETNERGDANRLGSNISQEQFEDICHKMDTFDIGCKSINIDTTNFENVNFDEYIRLVSEFLDNDV